MAERRSYPADSTDPEWQILEPIVPPVEGGGRPAEHLRRKIVNAILGNARWIEGETDDQLCARIGAGGKRQLRIDLSGALAHDDQA